MCRALCPLQRPVSPSPTPFPLFGLFALTEAHRRQYDIAVKIDRLFLRVCGISIEKLKRVVDIGLALIEVNKLSAIFELRAIPEFKRDKQPPSEQVQQQTEKAVVAYVAVAVLFLDKRSDLLIDHHIRLADEHDLKAIFAMIGEKVYPAHAITVLPVARVKEYAALVDHDHACGFGARLIMGQGERAEKSRGNVAVLDAVEAAQLTTLFGTAGEVAHIDGKISNNIVALHEPLDDLTSCVVAFATAGCATV